MTQKRLKKWQDERLKGSDTGGHPGRISLVVPNRRPARRSDIDFDMARDRWTRRDSPVSLEKRLCRLIMDDVVFLISVFARV